MLARRRRLDLLEAGLDMLFQKWFGGFFGSLLAGLFKKAWAKYKADVIKWLSEKWLTDLDEYPEGDEQEFRLQELVWRRLVLEEARQQVR